MGVCSHPDATYLRNVRENTNHCCRRNHSGNCRGYLRWSCCGYSATRIDRYVIRCHIFQPAHSPRSAHIDTNNPAPGVYICADGDPPHDHRFAYTWTIVLVGESVFVVLSLYKGWQDWRTGYGSSILRILARDSVTYFVACVYLYPSHFHQALTATRRAGFSWCIC